VKETKQHKKELGCKDTLFCREVSLLIETRLYSAQFGQHCFTAFAKPVQTAQGGRCASQGTGYYFACKIAG
jgi:hypothetical protein